MNHLSNSFLVIFAEIDNASICFAKLAAASAVEEAASGAQDCSVNGPLLVIASNGQIRVFSSKMEPATSVSTTHDV